MREEERKLIRSLVFPGLFVFLLWVVWIVEQVGGYDWYFMGVYPRKWSGLIGVITSPLVHGSFSHILANSIPLLVLGGALFYFYRDIALKVFFLIYFITGIWVWFGAREAYHIGASGIVYGLSTFIFVSGIIRGHRGLMALALVVAFLYGSMIWGIFPEFFPEENISWESHLFGILAGTILALFYRKEGPQRKKYEWELEEEDEDENDKDDDGAYWKTNIPDEEVRKIKWVYKPRRPADPS